VVWEVYTREEYTHHGTGRYTLGRSTHHGTPYGTPLGIPHGTPYGTLLGTPCGIHLPARYTLRYIPPGYHRRDTPYTTRVPLEGYPIHHPGTWEACRVYTTRVHGRHAGYTPPRLIREDHEAHRAPILPKE